MSDIEQPSDPWERIPPWLRSSFGVVLGIAAFMWFMEIIDTIAGGRLDDNGIHPRSVDGLDGIIWSPFLHGGFGHLISNTIPFVLLSGLTLTQGFRRYVKASLIIIGSSGLLVWMFAFGGNENHIGASGWVFGLFGYLIASAWLEKRPLSIAVAVIAVALYGTTVLFGFIPRAGISWEGHLFGFIAGLVAARFLIERQPARAEINVDAP